MNESGSTQQGADSTAPNENLRMMALGEHLDELRVRFVKCLWAIAIIFFAAFAFANDILLYLQKPLLEALPKQQTALHFTGPMDVFIANIQVAFLAAIVGSSPIWIYQFWKFIEPALYQHEKKYIFPFVFWSIVLFFSGVAFCFYIMLPYALQYLIGLGLEIGTPIITIGDYLSLLFIMLFAFGVMFETPLVLILLAVLEVIHSSLLTKNRKVIIMIILIVAAVITPSPDAFSQFSLAIPTYLMFEISVIIIKIIEKKRLKQQQGIVPK